MLARILHWICRLALGGLFIYAAYTKLKAPLLFEMAVSAYQLLPVWAVIKVAWLLPRLELVLGVVLIVGWGLRYTATFTALLLAAFLFAMTRSYLRGDAIDCACFGLGEAVSPITLARDTILFLLAVFLAVSAWRQARLRLATQSH